MTNEDQFAVAVLAKRRARITVKAQLKARGIRVSYVPVREVAALARDYLLASRVGDSGVDGYQSLQAMLRRPDNRIYFGLIEIGIAAIVRSLRA